MAIYFSGSEIIEMAVQTEKSGVAFYTSAAESAREKSLKDVFQYLADEERKHITIFQGLYNSIEERPEKSPYDWQEVALYIKAMTDSRFFIGEDKATNLVKQAEDEKEVLRMAINFEKDTLLFFYELLDLVKADGRKAVREIISQEKSHVRQLSSLLKES